MAVNMFIVIYIYIAFFINQCKILFADAGVTHIEQCDVSIRNTTMTFFPYEHVLIYPMATSSCFVNTDERDYSSNIIGSICLINFEICKSFNISELQLENAPCKEHLHAGTDYICNRSKNVIENNYYSMPMFDLDTITLMMVEQLENGEKYMNFFKTLNLDFKLYISNYNLEKNDIIGKRVLLNEKQNVIEAKVLLDGDARALIISIDQPVHSLIFTFCKFSHPGFDACVQTLLQSYCLENGVSGIKNIEVCTDDLKSTNRRNERHTKLFDPVQRRPLVEIAVRNADINMTYVTEKKQYESSRHTCLNTASICEAANRSPQFCAKMINYLHGDQYGGIKTLSPTLPFGRKHMFMPFFQHESFYSMEQVPKNYLTNRFRITYLVLTKVLPYYTSADEEPGINNEQERVRNGWGKGLDIIFVAHKNLFRTLLVLFHDEMNSTYFRPCLQWLVIVDSDTYVNKTNLFQFLEEKDSIRPYYFGNDVQIFDANNKTPFNCDAVKYPLTSSTQPTNVKYATFSGGIILSRGLLELLITRIYISVPDFASENRYTRSYCYSVAMNDARLGGCIYYELGIALTVEKTMGKYLAPTCPFDHTNDEDGDTGSMLQSEITLRHATYGKSCRDKVILSGDNDKEIYTGDKLSKFKQKSDRWKKTLSSLIIGITSYHKDRRRTKSLVETIMSTLSDMEKKHFDPMKQIIIYDEDENLSNNFYSPYAKVQKVPNNICPGIQGAQLKMAYQILDLCDRVDTNEFRFALGMDSDIAINLKGVVDLLYELDYENEGFVLGDYWEAQTRFSQLGGLYIINRKAGKLTKRLIVNHWLQQKVMPLELLKRCNDTIIDTIKLKYGDVWMTYAFKHSGNIPIHIPGIYASTAPCNLQYHGLSMPIIAIHGMYGDDDFINETPDGTLAVWKHHKDAQLLYIQSNNVLQNINKIRKNINDDNNMKSASKLRYLSLFEN